ncbi:MAG: hypothetical protein IT563_08740 [Alphaproteobacteria bacterium]|nr:hypothetical protein [Alphaproteobacteria bacterium]
MDLQFALAGSIASMAVLRRAGGVPADGRGLGRRGYSRDRPAHRGLGDGT